MSLSSLTIVIVSYNTCAQTLACLASVTAEQRLLAVAGVAADVVVVDNGSRDDTVAAIRAEVPAATVVEAGANLGFARAVNLGARSGAGDGVLLLNPDTLVLPGALVAMVAFAQQHGTPAIVGGRTVDEDGALEPSSCWGAPTLWSLACFASGLSTVLRGNAVFDPESLGGWRRDSVREVAIVTGCLLLCPRATWDELGGMDEAYFLYGEDADFSLRAQARGIPRILTPDAVIVHTVGGSTERRSGSNGRKMTMVLAGKTTLARRLWSPQRARVAVALLALGCAVRALGERALRRPGTWSDVWRQRDIWRQGYPAATAALFPDARTPEEVAS